MGIIKILRKGKFKAKELKPKVVVKVKAEKKPKRVPRRSRRFDDDPKLIFDAYECARAGMSIQKMAEYFNAEWRTIAKWIKTQPLFAEAVNRGKTYYKQENGVVTFRDYVYKRLSPELQELWDEINACEKERNGLARMEALFKRKGLRARQHLFLYAYTASSFNASVACRKVGISKDTLELWIEKDPEFAKLEREIHWHKGNFFESALVGAVKAKETAAILFANRTFNKDRGYGIKVEHQVNGQINHTHHHTVDIDALQLPIEVRRALLDAMEKEEELRKKSEVPLALGYDEPEAIDAEIVEKEEA